MTRPDKGLTAADLLIEGDAPRWGGSLPDSMRQVRPDDDLPSVVNMFLHHDLDSLPVVDNGRQIGTVRRAQAMKGFLSYADAQRRHGLAKRRRPERYWRARYRDSCGHDNGGGR